MPRRPRSPLAWTWLAACAVLAVSGMAQMPIFKRYYIADVPGLGWTADFFFTHTLHYVAAAVLLALAGAWTARALGGAAGRPSPSGLARIALLAVVVLTGLVRVAKNMHGVWLAPDLVMLVDWTHLGAAMGFGLAALWARLRGREPYARTGAGRPAAAPRDAPSAGRQAG